MAFLREDCPRCGTKNVTFNVEGQNSRGIVSSRWVESFEVFSICSHCSKATIFIVNNNKYELAETLLKNNSLVRNEGYINGFCDVKGYLSLKDNNITIAPSHTPSEIAEVFKEGSTCISVQCWNAAGAMFRTAIDLTTKTLLPPEDEEPNNRIRKSLGLRLQWLFENGQLPLELKELAEAVQQDGNDGVHDASLLKHDALDLQDFTQQLLNRIYTVPGKIREAADRRAARRASE